MLKFENTDTYGFEHALRGMRNPMNSWDKADSSAFYEEKACDKCPNNIEETCSMLLPCPVELKFVIGPNDLKLAQSLIKAGSEHRKFLRQIEVWVDITAPLYWWKEYDTYKVGTVANSCSTMHKITAKAFALADFSYERLEPISLKALQNTIDVLNYWREIYVLGNKDRQPKDKEVWYQLIQLLPSSYNQKRAVTLDYENIYSMIRQRQHHKLDEWSKDFIAWARSLPYADELLFYGLDDTEKSEASVSATTTPVPVESTTQFDAVSKPSHYAAGDIECIDAMIAAYGSEAVKDFCKCNAFKYQWRFDKKNGEEDIKKAQWYQNKLMELNNAS